MENQDINENKAVPSEDAVNEPSGQTIKEVIVVYDDDNAIKYELPREFNNNHTIGKITWTPTSNSGGGSPTSVSKIGGKKSRKPKSKRTAPLLAAWAWAPKSKRIRVRKTRRRKH